MQSWDIATTVGERNDYSAGLTFLMLRGDYYLVDAWRGRLEFPDLRRRVIDLAKRHNVSTTIIEDAGPGQHLLQAFRYDCPPGMTRPIGWKPEGSKLDRMVAQTAKIEAGHLHLPKEAEWLPDFLNEVLGFPYGRHDDQVDALSQFLAWAAQDMYGAHYMVAGPILITVDQGRHSGPISFFDIRRSHDSMPSAHRASPSIALKGPHLVPGESMHGYGLGALRHGESNNCRPRRA